MWSGGDVLSFKMGVLRRMWHIWERMETHTKGEHLEDIGIDGMIILKLILNE